MNITVSQKNLKQALFLVERVAARNSSLPILQNILLKTEQGRLRVSATNLEIGITMRIGAKIEEVGEIAIPGRILSEFISTIQQDAITLTTKNNSLFVDAEHCKTQILGFDAKEYPLIPKIKEPPICRIPGAVLKDIAASILDSVAISEARPELAGMCMRFAGDTLVCAATDSFRLIERMVSLKSVANQTIIIPRATVTELIRIGGEVSDDLDMRIGDNQLSLVSDDFELVSRLVDGKYPEYAKFIPEKALSKALVSKDDLGQKIRLAGLFSSSISDVKLECSDNSITIAAKNSSRGEVKASLPALLKNEPFEIILNFQYLLDGLKAISTPKVLLEFTGQGGPLVMRPDDDKRSLVYLVMPLRQ